MITVTLGMVKEGVHGTMYLINTVDYNCIEESRYLRIGVEGSGVCRYWRSNW